MVLLDFRKDIRKILYNEEWFFVINDILQILTDTTNVKQYWQKMNRREPELLKGGVQLVRLLSIVRAVNSA